MNNKAHFGSEIILNTALTKMGRLGFKIYGTPFIGGYLRFLYLKKILKLMDRTPTNILDAGCGSGSYSFYLARNFKNAKIFGCDLLKSDIDKCKKRALDLGILNISFYTQDLLKNLPENNYDFIISIDVLEHIKENRIALKNLISSLKTSGYIFLHLPYIDWLDHSIFPESVFKQYKNFELKEHIGKPFSIHDLVDELKKLNCKIIYKQNTFNFFGRLAWELNQFLMEKKLTRLQALGIPMFKTLCKIEILLNLKETKKPGGMLVLAQKK